jgi:hypothetical protein
MNFRQEQHKETSDQLTVVPMESDKEGLCFFSSTMCHQPYKNSEERGKRRIRYETDHLGDSGSNQTVKTTKPDGTAWKIKGSLHERSE